MFSQDLTTTYTFTLEKSLLKYHISINTILSRSFHQSKVTYLCILYSHPISIVFLLYFLYSSHLTSDNTVQCLLIYCLSP